MSAFMAGFWVAAWFCIRVAIVMACAYAIVKLAGWPDDEA